MSQIQYTYEEIQKVEQKLSEIFQSKKIEFHQRSEFRDRNFIYFLNVKIITPEIQSKWSETFHNGSYYGIGKGVNQPYLNLTFDITMDDLKEVSKN